MAKNDNLKDFLTDVANAIREKKGTTDKINPQNFSAEIASIESGGGEVVSKAPNDVNFFDHEGIIHYSYTAEEFLALAEMPPLPTKKGLICQGWNWTWQEAYDYVAEYGILDVGAMFITDDGATRLYIRIANEGRMDVPLYLTQVSGTIVVDWGDGTPTETIEGTDKVMVTHTYANMGDYVIRLLCSEGEFYLGHVNQYAVLGDSGTSIYNRYLQNVAIGSNMTKIRGWAFRMCHSLTSISIPCGVVEIGTMTTQQSAIKSLVVPMGVKTMGTQMNTGCSSMNLLSLPCDIISYLVAHGFYENRSLFRVVLPTDITKISIRSLGGCRSLSRIKIPKTVNTLEAECFINTENIHFFDFTHHEAVPTLANVNAFNSTPTDCEIRVPKALEEEWKQATNWCDLADKIVGYD